jgi:hypothetical protein
MNLAPSSAQKLHEERAPSDGTDRLNETPAAPHGLHLASRSNSAFTVRNELPVKTMMACFVSLATWIVSRMEKRSVDEYGIPLGQVFGRRLWEGSAWGVRMLSAILLILRASGHFQIDSVALAGGAMLRWGLAWGATFLAVSLSEELAFRGYWLFTMARRMRFWPAVLFLSAVFGAAHLGNHGENVLGVVQVVATGLLFCLMIHARAICGSPSDSTQLGTGQRPFSMARPTADCSGVGRLLNSSVRGGRIGSREVRQGRRGASLHS